MMISCRSLVLAVFLWSGEQRKSKQCEDSTFSNACKGLVVPSSGLTYEIQVLVIVNGLERPVTMYSRTHHQSVAHGYQKSEKQTEAKSDSNVLLFTMHYLVYPSDSRGSRFTPVVGTFAVGSKEMLLIQTQTLWIQRNCAAQTSLHEDLGHFIFQRGC